MSEADKDDEDNKQFIDEIIYPDIEPGIINRAMIESAYLEEGYRGEARRLHQLQPVVLDAIKTIRLEFKNILRIDHLWILPNLTKLCLNCNKIEIIEGLETLTALKDLNLSFNYIDKIDNLPSTLETLSLFSNRITILENMDHLEKLTIFSVGNNLITTVDGLDRFRFLKNLKVLNLEGNPIAKQPDFSLSQYIMAILPQLNYYDYIFIKDEMREEAVAKYARDIRDVESKQEKEIQERKIIAREEAEAERLASSFVEHLDGHQLYESLWRGDEDGRILMQVGAQAHELAEEYAKDVFELTQEIYLLGLSRFGERDEEITDFMANLKEGQEELQALGQEVIEDFLKYKEQTFESLYKKLRQIEQHNIQGIEDSTSVELSEEVDRIFTEFDEAMSNMWQTLMTQELHLHEAVEESTTNFHRKISELMAKFVEQAQAYFVQLREVSVHFSENMTEIVTRYITTKSALQDFEGVPPELRVCMDDRDAIVNLVAGMKDSHSYRIDEREDRMATRTKDFIDTMIDKLNNAEKERHRAKILEINSFIEMMTEAIQALPNEVREEVIAEEYA